MPIVLCRVDDRLVHGQVVIGWGRPLGIELIVLVDDEVAGSDWEQDLYRMAVPPEIERAVRHAWRRRPRQLAAWQGDGQAWAGPHRRHGDHGRAASRRVRRWCSRSISAGIHHRPGRRERLPYVYLTDEELAVWSALEAEGAEITRAGPAHDAARAAPGHRMTRSRRPRPAAGGLGHAGGASTS